MKNILNIHITFQVCETIDKANNKSNYRANYKSNYKTNYNHHITFRQIFTYNLELHIIRKNKVIKFYLLYFIILLNMHP